MLSIKLKNFIFEVQPYTVDSSGTNLLVYQIYTDEKKSDIIKNVANIDFGITIGLNVFRIAHCLKKSYKKDKKTIESLLANTSIEFKITDKDYKMISKLIENDELYDILEKHKKIIYNPCNIYIYFSMDLAMIIDIKTNKLILFMCVLPNTSIGNDEVIKNANFKVNDNVRSKSDHIIKTYDFVNFEECDNFVKFIAGLTKIKTLDIPEFIYCRGVINDSNHFMLKLYDSKIRKIDNDDICFGDMHIQLPAEMCPKNIKLFDNFGYIKKSDYAIEEIKKMANKEEKNELHECIIYFILSLNLDCFALWYLFNHSELFDDYGFENFKKNISIIKDYVNCLNKFWDDCGIINHPEPTRCSIELVG